MTTQTQEINALTAKGFEQKDLSRVARELFELSRRIYFAGRVEAKELEKSQQAILTREEYSEEEFSLVLDLIQEQSKKTIREKTSITNK